MGYYPRSTKEKDFSVLTCDDAAKNKGTNNVDYIYTIMHAIANYWPQAVKQVLKSWISTGKNQYICV